MKKTKGFTLIELMIVVAIIAILAAVFLPLFFGSKTSNKVSYGYNGFTETRCIEGYKFVVGEGGQARQLLDAEGRGVPCQ